MSPRLTHFAINTDDVDATQAFYGSVFGWQFREYGPPGFIQILDESGETPMGSIQQRRQLLDDAPTLGFECTFGVESIDAVRERILAAGGKSPDGQVDDSERRSSPCLPRSWWQPCSCDGVRHFR